MISRAVSQIFKWWEPLKLEGDIRHVRHRRRREKQILNILDGIGFSWRVYLVAFMGFLASSWSLIAINITTPALFYLYGPESGAGEGDGLPRDADLVLDMVTLGGTVVGMIGFGHIADRLGRSALYGFELLIVLAAIGGAAFSSRGYTDPKDGSSSMKIYASLIWWRATLGLGIGAEYPMSAVIASEFTATSWRGTMLAAIFLAQGIGRVLAYGLSLGILHGYRQRTPNIDDEASVKLAVDSIWRLVLGLAGVPAVFAIGLRIFIPETPRFYSAIKRDLNKALGAATKIGSTSPPPQDAASDDSDELDAELPYREGGGARPAWSSTFWTYLFGESRGWKRLTSLTLQWLLLDIAFYGTGLDSPRTLAGLMMDQQEDSQKTRPIWNEDPKNPKAHIYDVLKRNSERTLCMTSIAAVTGSLAVIPLIGLVRRRTLYVWTSGALALVFAAASIAVSQTYAKPGGGHYASVVLYALTQFLFNLGPNTLTFVVAAEIFPTEFRGTCYGVAAAGGKVGAIVARLVSKNTPRDKDGLCMMLAMFSGILAVMAALALFAPFGIGIPDTQTAERRYDSSGGSGRRRAICGGGPGGLTDLSLEEISPWPLVEGEEGEDVVEYGNEAREMQQSRAVGINGQSGDSNGGLAENGWGGLPPPAQGY
ncbi:hypothetical protein RB595_009232 [Gaeumannomyces hyphopodioides]